MPAPRLQSSARARSPRPRGPSVPCCCPCLPRPVLGGFVGLVAAALAWAEGCAHCRKWARWGFPLAPNTPAKTLPMKELPALAQQGQEADSPSNAAARKAAPARATPCPASDGRTWCVLVDSSWPGVCCRAPDPAGCVLRAPDRARCAALAGAATPWPVGFAALRSVLEVVAEIATFGDFCGVSAGNKRGQKNLSFGQPVDNIVVNY